MSFNDLQESFDGFIRPKLRSFFKGGLTRRIDAVVPFFKFSREEAYVVADMYIDTLREMYAKPKTPGKQHQVYVSKCPHADSYCWLHYATIYLVITIPFPLLLLFVL